MLVFYEISKPGYRMFDIFGLKETMLRLFS